MPFGFSAPQEAILDMLSNIRTSQGYSDSKGIFSARKAMMQYAQLRNIPNVSMNDIYTGNGVSELINLCMQALLDHGDEILIPGHRTIRSGRLQPHWPGETLSITSAMNSQETGILISMISEARSQIRQKQSSSSIRITRGRTGAVYPKEILEQIVQIARERELIIFSDEIYDRLVMERI